MPLITFGHGTASAERIAGLLGAAEVTALVDVRIAPGSRRHPHVARAELERWLPGHGISYRWEKRLGGFRRPAPDSPDVTWREDAFRGYAGYMRQPEFAAAIDEVLAQVAAQPAGSSPTSRRSPAGCRSAISFTTAGWRSTAPRRGSGCAKTACWSTTQARNSWNGDSRISCHE